MSSPSPVSLPRTTRVASPSRVPPRPRSKRPFQSKGLVTVFMRESRTGRVTTIRRRSSLIIRLDEEKVTRSDNFWSARFLEATTKKRSLVPLFIYLFQRTCTKITFIPFVFDLIASFRLCHYCTSVSS